jgi:3'-phosphoadenosine 5'-phosphosulfate sulfotransferase (PAPS reductase)/FAD synthetase
MTGPPRKQNATHEQWVQAFQTVRERVPEVYVDELVERTAARVRSVGSRMAYAWSGGKESVALGHVCEIAGVDQAVLVVCELEFPEFLRWVDVHRPAGLVIENTGQDLHWLAGHPQFLFPTTGPVAARWFGEVQHRGQKTYFLRHRLDAMLLGRRLADGNYVGGKGVWTYKNADGVVRSSPMYDWTNDDVLAVIAWRNLPLAPFYQWPRGFRVGTGPWPKRRVESVEQGWSEVWAIDPTVVQHAAGVFPSAAEFIGRR